MISNRSILIKTIVIVGGIATPDRRKTSTLLAENTGMNHQGPKVWMPGYAGRSAPKTGEYDKQFKNVLPTDWTCPCGAALHGAKSCPNCGRVPMDTEKKRLDGYQSMDTGRELKRWKKFAKRGH